MLRLGVETALPEISAWEERLAASGDPDLKVVSATLGALLGATLESVRRRIEEGSGKLPPPSPEG